MVDSPWRHPDLADLTFGEIYRLVERLLPARKQRILDIGCGTGFLSLELARDGHKVLGMDIDMNLVKLAERTMKTDPYQSKLGSLDYQVSDFSTWDNQGKIFDVVIFIRSLHHIPKPGRALDKARHILSPRGRIVCLDFAFDRFDRQSARWLYHIRRAMEQAGWYKTDKRLSEDAKKSVSQIMKESRDYPKKEKLNMFGQMYKPLKRLFAQQHFSWHPYIFWDIVMDMRVPSPDIEIAIARSAKAMEEALIRRHTIKPTLFVFEGRPRR